MLQIKPVFEAPWYEKQAPWPWEIASINAFSFIPATGVADDSIVGSFFAGFAPILDPPDKRDFAVRLEDIIELGATHRIGGLWFENETTQIYPGCCGDLSALNEWGRFLFDGSRPWTGHDPSPWATIDGDEVVIWNDGGLSDERLEPCIRASKDSFQEKLSLAFHELSSFGTLCIDWLRKHEIPRAEEIETAIAKDFTIQCSEPKTVVRQTPTSESKSS